MKIEKVNKYDKVCYENVAMDILRKTECLCLNCKDIEFCEISKDFFNTCKFYGTAVMVTRCPYFKQK